jgi:hypothetical protein
MARVRDFSKRAPRVDIRRIAVLVDADGGEAGVVILDVSSGGFRLKVRGICGANPLGARR